MPEMDGLALARREASTGTPSAVKAAGNGKDRRRQEEEFEEAPL